MIHCPNGSEYLLDIEPVPMLDCNYKEMPQTAIKAKIVNYFEQAIVRADDYADGECAGVYGDD